MQSSIYNDTLSNFLSYIQINQYDKIITRILVAVIIGGIIGFEREHKNRPAGFRTHVLVCVSACSLMILSDILFIKYYNNYGIALDPQRIGAQVISGIGFLGAGTIMHFGNSVRGLTTAASIWAVAALGLIVGSGHFFLAFFALITIELTLICFDNISDNKIFKQKKTELFITVFHSPEIIGNITMFLAENNIEILEIDFKSFNECNSLKDEESISKLKLVVNVQKSDISVAQLMEILSKIKGIISLQI